MDDRDVSRFRVQMKLLQRRLRRESLPAYGVSRTALQVITAVVRLPEGAQPRRIAEELRMTSSNVAAALRELEGAGYVRRRKDATDARRVAVLLTDSGRTMVADVRSERDTWLGRAITGLLDEDEQRILLAAGALMERLAAFERTPEGADGHPAAHEPVPPYEPAPPYEPVPAGDRGTARGAS
ncbi:MarR family winged helix-turn-helix transcriptional regulator [Actinacidiphila alni]|uniref:MarR family winged helix-turn-helix transcriptional regulator n=1 Tax=Actinacidiphila alni TaxID=380248 RepID=UPI003408BFF5